MLGSIQSSNAWPPMFLTLFSTSAGDSAVARHVSRARVYPDVLPRLSHRPEGHPDDIGQPLGVATRPQGPQGTLAALHIPRLGVHRPPRPLLRGHPPPGIPLRQGRHGQAPAARPRAAAAATRPGLFLLHLSTV